MVRVLPSQRGCRLRRKDQDLDQRKLQDRCQPSERRQGDGLRHSLHATDSPDWRELPQGPKQHSDCWPAGPGFALGHWLGGRRPRHDPPRPRNHRRLRCLCEEGEPPRSRDRHGPSGSGIPRPPLGEGTPRMVHHPRRRHHCLRREPTEEVPGHVPGQLRQRP